MASMVCCMQCMLKPGTRIVAQKASIHSVRLNSQASHTKQVGVQLGSSATCNRQKDNKQRLGRGSDHGSSGASASLVEHH